MSQANLEVVRALVEAWNRHDVDAFVALLHEDVEWHDRALFPDAAVHRGHEAVERHLREIEANLDLRWEIEEIVDLGDHVLLAATLRGRGKKSGAQFEDKVFATAQMHDGKVRLRQSYSTRAEALIAIEASESK